MSTTWGANTPAVNLGIYAGAYDSLHNSTDDPMPLWIGTLNSATNAPQGQAIPGTNHWGGAFTREHLAGTSPTSGFQGGIEGLFNVVTRIPEFQAATTKEKISNRYFPARLYLVTQSEGGIKGLLKDVYAFSLGNITEAADDTLTSGGTTYRCVTAAAGDVYHVAYNTCSCTSQALTCFLWVCEAA